MKVVSGSPWGQLGPGGVRGGVWVPVGGRCHRRSVSSEVMSPHHCCFPIIIRPGRGRRGRGPSRRQPSENRALPAFLSSSLPFSETLWLGHRSPQGGWAARYLSPATSREEVWAHAPCKSVRLAWGQSGMCSAARDSSVTAGLVWACLRRACLWPARARALGEGSGDRASRPGPLLPAPPPSRPPSFHSPVRPFVCRDAEVAVCPLYCVAGGAGVLQASVLAGEGHGEGSECRFTVTGEPALGHPSQAFGPPSRGAESSPGWPPRALWGPGSVTGSWFVSRPSSRLCLWGTSSGPRADQDSHQPSSPAAGVHVAFSPFPDRFWSYFSNADWPAASPLPSRVRARPATAPRLAAAGLLALLSLAPLREACHRGSSQSM